MNERIRAREVRLIDENGAQLGVVQTREALRIARERGLDLIEVAPTAQPPVCRIMDYGKHKYQQAKRERDAHKRVKPTEVRLLRLKPQIGPHDLEIKLRKLRELLAEGNKVRVNLRFRGREASHPELGSQLLNRIAQALGEDAVVEGPPRFEGRMMNMLLAPKLRPKPAAPPKPSAPAKETGPTQGTAPPAVAPAVAPAPAEPAAPVPAAAVAPVKEQAPAPAAQAPVTVARPAPITPEKVVSDAKEQVPRPQDADAEDSGEAG